MIWSILSFYEHVYEINSKSSDEQSYYAITDYASKLLLNVVEYGTIGLVFIAGGAISLATYKICHGELLYFFYFPFIDEKTTYGLGILFTYNVMLLYATTLGIMIGEMQVSLVIANIWTVAKIFEENLTRFNRMLETNPEQKTVKKWFQNIEQMHQDICW